MSRPKRRHPMRGVAAADRVLGMQEGAIRDERRVDRAPHLEPFKAGPGWPGLLGLPGGTRSLHSIVLLPAAPS
jgi:hypothetical protein